MRPPQPSPPSLCWSCSPGALSGCRRRPPRPPPRRARPTTRASDVDRVCGVASRVRQARQTPPKLDDDRSREAARRTRPPTWASSRTRSPGPRTSCARSARRRSPVVTRSSSRRPRRSPSSAGPSPRPGPRPSGPMPPTRPVACGRPAEAIAKLTELAGPLEGPPGGSRAGAGHGGRATVPGHAESGHNANRLNEVLALLGTRGDGPAPPGNRSAQARAARRTGRQVHAALAVRLRGLFYAACGTRPVRRGRFARPVATQWRNAPGQAVRRQVVRQGCVTLARRRCARRTGHTGGSGKQAWKRAGQRGRIDTGEEEQRRKGPGRRRLVIVESPAKARKIASYLGRNFVVESSSGHIRDLPRKRRRRARQVQGRGVGPPRRRRRQRLRAALRRHAGQEVDRSPS